MAERQEAHARSVVARFEQMLGEQLTREVGPDHLEELVLLIESAIDAAVLASSEQVADQLEKMAHEVRNQAERFSG